MSQFQIKQLFDGNRMLHDCILTVENGAVTSLLHDQALGSDALDGIVCPGFIDTQVNGGGGALFNHDQSLDTLDRIARAHRQFGTTALLPTLITDKQSKMVKAADAIAEAIANNHQNIIGVHFEGPHLSKTKRGIHAAGSIRHIDDAALNTYLRQDLGKVMLTIAPEALSPDVIKELTAKGVIISLGHSNADFETVVAAIAAGARGFTHLFNAMSGLKAREPGMIGAALTQTEAYVGIITDMQHVHPANCRLAVNCVGPQRLMLVTDAMAHVGSTMQSMTWEDTVITRHGDKLLTEDGTFAGSCLDMAGAVKNMVNQVHLPLADALQMATSTPAQFLNSKDRGFLKSGCRADFIQLNSHFSVQQCWINGKVSSVQG
ncbi:N-acetylglucosamine-6-phosphate deacetylase [Alteromonas ponticola]|uniref:N-acetylgalactosamine-6-phosphate deacetylase n=1 Tax=Alteromonas aquimaris TaxID=2998417 RepID=A0ABT3P6N5_9ALTE|nr:N-acetylglucosamine-6-phosphate deacetylase [Alteromonas aquimaris]MCW8108432.1 N-acetylglucosamine-6-phosphate deacetylase [Alteromonas aquimaris]